ncbi:MAG: hypothetical protein JXK07_11850 [Spirochaetes bacterium]|nr:hypothetical protein [Spirochaetota bacterium]
MNALYSCCTVDPWLDVARILKDKYNIEPVYWIGKDNDHSREIIPSEFSESVYHEYFDAWKGVFPNEIDKIANHYCVDIDFYKQISNYELQGLTQMDRMDEDQHSFGFSERRNLFRKFLRYWIAVVDFYKVEILISPKIPHQSFDYVLYLVCQNKGIKFLSTVHTPFSNAGRLILLENLDDIPAKIVQDYKKLSKSKNHFQLDSDITSYFEAVRMKYEDAMPKNFIEYNRFHKKRPSVIKTGKKFLYELPIKKQVWFGKNGYLLKGVPKYRKQPNKQVEESKTRYKLIPYIHLIYKRIKFLKSLEKEYSRISQEPDLNKPFVVFALHYQPEATSLPRGGMFHDQLYIIELLSKHLPKDWNIYVKENPKQFNPLGEGATCRLLRFYRDAMEFPRVSFIPVDYNPFTLIDEAKAVITIAGTMGWEAMVRKKPVICFGQSWYESFTHGVYRINNNQDLKGIVDFIKNFTYSEHKLLAYLKAVEKNSIIAYHYQGLKDKLKMEKAECTKVLVESVAKHFDLLFSMKQ